ncbi:MAG: hypothetical protein IT290_07380 [Deltaproteobacteria bacterium]|nr:hypothetical protein [Deltaproteobacteria bacterium]
MRRPTLRCLKSILALGPFLVLVALAAPVESDAQSVSATGTGRTVKDADEYFTDVLHSGRNFDTTCDTGFNSWSYEPYSTGGGAWTGAHPERQGGVLGILPIPTIGTNIAVSREDCGQLGFFQRSLLAAKYTNSSFRMRNSSPSTFSFLWSLSPTNYAVGGWGQNDGTQLSSGFQTSAPNAWTIYDQHMPSKAPAGTPWSGEIFGITLIPSFFEPAGGITGLDWFRVYDPNSDDTFNVSWSSSGSFLTSGATRDFISVVVDTDAAGYDGSVIAREQPLSGSYAVSTGGLPPGRYYFYLQQDRHSPTSIATRARSNYIGPLIVNGKPQLKFISPSKRSGRAYSRDVLGNAWDMNGPEDVANANPALAQRSRYYHDWSFANGYFHATSDQDPDNNHLTFEIDTQVTFPVSPTVPIIPAEWRYFCTRMQIDSTNLPRNGDAVGLNRAGWVSRVVWQDRTVRGAIGSSLANELVERSNAFPDYANGLTTYCFDMQNPANHESGTTWQSIGKVTSLRFYPVEATPATRFALDFAELYAENRNSNDGRYLIQWSVRDPEQNPVTMDLYYGSDARGGIPGVRFASLNASQVASGSFAWDTRGVATGTYFITAIVSDGLNRASSVSDVPVTVTTLPEPITPGSPGGGGGTLTPNAISRSSISPGRIDGSARVKFRARVRNGVSPTGVFVRIVSPNGSVKNVALKKTRERNIYERVVRVSHTKGRRARSSERWRTQFYVTGPLGTLGQRSQSFSVRKYD